MNDNGRPSSGRPLLSVGTDQLLQVKLAAEFSVPGAPVNFGHVGHSQSGRVRFALGFALGFASIAVRRDGG